MHRTNDAEIAKVIFFSCPVQQVIITEVSKDHKGSAKRWQNKSEYNAQVVAEVNYFFAANPRTRDCD